MKIYVDADACPVKNIIIKVALKYKIEVIMVCDTSHIISDPYSKVITVDKSRDSADLVLINLVKKNDIVVTQDYGVACLAISKNATAVSQNGIVYDSNNIDRLLFERFLSKKVRMSGGKIKNIPKRTKNDDFVFENVFNEIVMKGIEYESEKD